MDINKIKVEVDAAVNHGMAKCLRCWKYTHECEYDKNQGCKNLLCNRCAEVVTEKYQNDPAVIDFINERKKIYGKQRGI